MLQINNCSQNCTQIFFQWNNEDLSHDTLISEKNPWEFLFLSILLNIELHFLSRLFLWYFHNFFEWIYKAFSIKDKNRPRNNFICKLKKSFILRIDRCNNTQLKHIT